MEQFGDKQHEATPHRRQQAREQGQVPRSQDLASALLLLGALLLMLYLGDGITSFLSDLARTQLGGDAWLRLDQESAVDHWHRILLNMGMALAPIMGLLMLIGAGAHLSQVGFLFLPEKVGFDVSRLSPAKGFGRLFSMANAMKLAFGIFKILVVVGVAVWSLWSDMDRILAASAMDVPKIAAFIGGVIFWTCLKIAAALLILAILDYAFQRWKHEQDLRMTDQEIREEMKNLQGDPQVIARRRQIQRQLVLNRMSSTIPQSDVVVTNPTELAIAIRYDIESMPAPIVVAKGAGVLAQRIRRLALENDVPIVERKELAQLLYKNVDVNQAIPSEQYAAVAEVLRYVYQLKGKSLPTG
ncbi:MAG: flagellar biosynthesis protein FlhB [Pirellulaceae bacterium]